MSTLRDSYDLITNPPGGASALAPPQAMVGTEVDTDPGTLNTLSITADDTLTFASTQTGASFALRISNTDSADHVVNIPTCFSVGLGANISVVRVPGNGEVNISFDYDGTNYRIYGEPISINDLDSPIGALDTANDVVQVWSVAENKHVKAPVIDV